MVSEPLEAYGKAPNCDESWFPYPLTEGIHRIITGSSPKNTVFGSILAQVFVHKPPRVRTPSSEIFVNFGSQSREKESQKQNQDF